MRALVDWARSQALRPYVVGGPCCAVEGAGALLAALRPRGGVPSECDLLIVAGPVSEKMTPDLLRIHQQMRAPKWVMAIGTCACSGGAWQSYAACPGVDQILPVDIMVPGCPPTADQCRAAMVALQQIVRMPANRPRAGGAAAGEGGA